MAGLTLLPADRDRDRRFLDTASLLLSPLGLFEELQNSPQSHGSATLMPTAEVSLCPELFVISPLKGVAVLLVDEIKPQSIVE